jgi:hypothetical protein
MQSLDASPGEGASARGVISSEWRKSTRSIGNGQCVEAAQLADGRLAMRDSTDMTGPSILFAQEAWHTFLKKVKKGDPGIS